MKKLVFTIVLLMFGFVGTAQANLITNGDFQTGDASGWQHATNVSVTTGGGGNSIARFDASNTVARLYQNFDVPTDTAVLTVSFRFRFWETPHGASNDFFRSLMRFEIFGGGPDFVTTLMTQHDNMTGWQDILFNIDLTGVILDLLPHNARLTFVLSEHVDVDSRAALDNVVVKAVPEPTTLALMGLGLAGIGWKRRKA